MSYYSFKKKASIENNFSYAFVLTVIIISIDIITNIFFPNYYIISKKFTLNQTIITFIIFIWISFMTSGYKRFFTLLFISFTFIEVNYFAFFRGYLQPYQIQLLFTEFSDILDSLRSIISIIAALSIWFLLIYFFIIRSMLERFIYVESNNANYSFIVFLSLIVFYANYKPQMMQIAPLNYSYINMIYTSSLATNDIFDDETDDDFKDYNVTKINDGKQNIIVIMGESLSYKRMNLFGFELQNTPNLNALKDNPRFFYTKAISSGVNTPVSVMSFFNVRRELKNMELLQEERTNLLKLARQNNYKTFWLSMQEEGMSIASILKYANIVKVRNDWEEPRFDDRLVEYLSQIDFSKKNFIVLHLRANHSPYETYTPPSFIKKDYSSEDYHTYKVNTYNESVIYVDYILNEIYKYMDSTKQPFKIYFTSDHAERLGYEDDNNKYGHSQLDIEATKVPYLIYSSEDLNLTKELSNHYLIGKSVAKDIGFEINNTNENNDTFYINGVNIDGNSGYIEYNKNQIKQ